MRFKFSNHALSLKLLNVFFSLVFFIVFAGSAIATTRYVPTTAYPTIQSAIDSSTYGDSVVVSPGTYDIIAVSWIQDLVIISTEGADSTVIEPDTASSQPVVSLIGVINVELNGFTIRGGTNSGILLQYGNAIIVNNIIEANSSDSGNDGGGLNMLYTAGSIIKENIFRNDTAYTYGSAIHTDYSDNDTICYNLFYDNYGYMEIRCLRTTAAIYNNTIDVEGSRAHGISNQLSGTIHCTNNIIVNAPGSYNGIYAANDGLAFAEYNDCYDNGGGSFGGTGLTEGSGNISADPLFVETPADSPDDYNIEMLSPCVDTGNPDSFFDDADFTQNDMGWRPWTYSLSVIFVPTEYTSIQAAIDAANDDDLIIVWPGTYTENIRFYGKKIAVRKHGHPDTAYIAAADVDEPVVQFVDNEPTGAEISGFTIMGSQDCGIECIGSSPLIKKNVIEDNYNGAIILNNTSDAIVKSNIIRNDSTINFGSTIKVTSSTNALISYNLVHDCYSEYEIFCYNSDSVEIYNNTIDVEGSEGFGIVTLNSYGIDCRNNIITNTPSGCYGIYAELSGDTEVAYNDFYNNLGGDWAGSAIVVGSGNIFDDPEFMNYYELSLSSPCIDAGDPDSIYYDPDGSRNDIGWKYWSGAAKSVTDEPIVEIPLEHSLLNNYPNPFNAVTTIEYNITQASMVTLNIYDILGRRVTKLVDSYQNAGTHTVTWDASNVPSGIYFYRIVTDNFSNSKKMLLLK